MTDAPTITNDERAQIAAWTFHSNDQARKLRALEAALSASEAEASELSDALATAAYGIETHEKGHDTPHKVAYATLKKRQELEAEVARLKEALKDSMDANFRAHSFLDANDPIEAATVHAAGVRARQRLTGKTDAESGK